MRKRIYKNHFSHLVMALIVALILSGSALAQATAFTYQGKLTDAGNPANGGYLVQFKLYDAAAGGTQIGSTISDVAVTVTNGVFNTSLDFGAPAFPGADRFLEISVKKLPADPYTILSPRQQISSSPYSIRTLSAAQADVALDSNKLGGVAAGQYVLTGDVRLTNDRNPLPNSANYIQNTTTQQTTTNFNIDGNGVVGGNIGIGTATPRATLDVAGNAVQNLSSNGFVKAMVLVTVAQTGPNTFSVTIVRCYNGVLNTSTGNCGFTPVALTNSPGFRAKIDFGFTVNDRFVSVTNLYDSSQLVGIANSNKLVFSNSTAVEVAPAAVPLSFFIFIY